MTRSLLAALLLAACADPKAPAASASIPHATGPAVEQSSWACVDGRALEAAFYEGPARVELSIDGAQRLTLLQADSGAGAIYEFQDVSFQAREERGLLTTGDRATLCKRTTEIAP
jgi:membrane-bound inhibitor of C-type lysozyme